MRNKLIAAVLALCMSVTLCGCQLAKPETSGDFHTGSLVGVFITMEPLSIEEASEQLIFGDSGVENSMIYAALRDCTDEDGKIFAREYYFPDLEGMSFFVPHITDTPDGEPYVATCADDGIVDVHFGLSETDNGEAISLSGTIYNVPGTERIFYLNPVYQNELSEVWAESGSGIAVSNAGSMSQTLNEKQTVTEDGISRELSADIRVTFETMDAPVSIRITEMDADNVKIAVKEYAPEEIPTDFTPDAQTEYLIIEHHTANGVTRAICEKSDAYFRTFFAREDGICVGNDIAVLWS